MEPDYNQLAQRAQDGDKESLEILIRFAQGYIYNLALRMLQLPMDAEDATQEILIKLITHLSQFRQESRFSTWMYRIAVNHLLTMRMRDREQAHLSFEQLATRLETSSAIYDANPEEVATHQMLIEEVKRSCTLGMLQCLNRDERMALVLAELIGLNSEVAADIMDITPATFRKKLSRARQAIVAFVGNACGIVNSASACRCHKHIQNKIAMGTLNPHQLNYAPTTSPECEAQAQLAEQTTHDVAFRTIALLRAHPTYAVDTAFLQQIREMFHQDDEA